MQSKRWRVIAAATAAAGLAVALNGCALAEAIDPPIESAIYATAPEGKSPDAPVTVPSWVPDDATTIRIKLNRDSGAEILQFTPAKVETGIGAPCPAPPSQTPPVLDDTWWLQNLPDDSAIVCQDGWFITAPTGIFYAWKNS